MNGFPILDLVVGMIFFYFLLSIITSSIVELILTLLKVRSKVLQKWLLTIFDKSIEVDNGKSVPLGQAIMNHCTNTALSGPNGSTAYIDAKNFTSALIEKITFIPTHPDQVVTDLNDVVKSITSSTALSPELKRVFILYANEAIQSSMTSITANYDAFMAFRGKIENWYNSSMDRVSGHLKRKYALPFTIIVATFTAGFSNADSIEIAKYLHQNPAAAKNLAEQGYLTGVDSTNIYLENIRQIKASNAQDSLKKEQITQALKKERETIIAARAVLTQTLPLGWDNVHIRSWFTKILGLLLTIFAIIMGAPFWFEILNKIANLRGSGAKPVKEEAKT